MKKIILNFALAVVLSSCESEGVIYENAYVIEDINLIDPIDGIAENFNRNELILPAILVGTLGNALGTYLGFFVIYVL